MQAYKTVVTIEKAHRLVLDNLPFQEGQRVEVVVLATEEVPVEALKALFAETQALPQVQALTDEEIAAEVAAYRAGQ